MKVKSTGPLAIMETENVLKTERYATFYNENQENTGPHPNKPGNMYDARTADKNTLGDPAKHINGIQSQQRPIFLRSISGLKVTAANRSPPIPAKGTSTPVPAVSTTTTTSSVPKPTIAAINPGPCKPLWQHTMTNPEEIQKLGLSIQDIQKQETIFELIYTESEYLDDLKSIHKVTLEEGVQHLRGRNASRH
jgi:hypothetical protein